MKFIYICSNNIFECGIGLIFCWNLLDFEVGSIGGAKSTSKIKF